MQEAAYYTKLEGSVRCTLCPHMCVLMNDELGRCRTRVNKHGVLVSLAYAQPCTVYVDPIEKKPLYHFLPGSKTLSIATGGCNLSCKNCQNHTISQASPTEVTVGIVSPEHVVEEALAYGCASISYTYTDPVVYYEYMLAVARIAHLKGLKNVMISAGYINEEPLNALLPFLDAANIDLKCFDDHLYQKLCGIHLKPVLQTLKRLLANKVWLEITCLIIPQYSDDKATIDRMVSWLVDNGFSETPIHFNRFVPAHQLSHLNATPTELLRELAEKAIVKGMKHVYVGNVKSHFYHNTNCPACRQLLIERKGYEIEKKVNKKNACRCCGQTLAGVWQ